MGRETQLAAVKAFELNHLPLFLNRIKAPEPVTWPSRRNAFFIDVLILVVPCLSTEKSRQIKNKIKLCNGFVWIGAGTGECEE